MALSNGTPSHKIPPVHGTPDETLLPLQVHETTEETKIRNCVICFTDPVEIMLLPCRHAVMCRECAESLPGRDAAAFGQGGVCPICRIPIFKIVLGTFEEDYVRLLTEAEKRFQWVEASAYTGMYNRIRILMSIGGLAGVGSVTCFLALPLPLAIVPGTCLATASFLVGYVPWFLTTAATFESENQSETQRLHQAFLSRDDLKKPLVLIGKVAALTIGMPIAACTFFVPYVCYNYVIRPALRVALYVIVRGIIWSIVYVICPTERGISRIISAFVKAAVWTSSVVGPCVISVARAIRDFVIEPLYSRILLPTGRRVRSAAVALNSFVLVPIWDCSAQAVYFVGRWIGTGLEHTYKWIIVPLGKVAVSLASCLYGYVLVPCGTVLMNLYYATTKYVLQPCAKAVHTVGVKCLECARAINEAVFRPCGRALFSVASTVASAMSPLGRAVSKAVTITRNAVAVISATTTSVFTDVRRACRFGQS